MNDSMNMLGSNLNFASAEAYKLLRTNLLFSLTGDKKCHIIGITSSQRGEGKSTTSINLAYTLAEAGKKVLLIDADMRLPTVAQKIDCPNSPGLSNILVGLEKTDNAIIESNLIEGLYILPSGDIPPNPSELLATEKMKKIVDAFVSEYDFVLFDLPPVNVVSDALVISKLTDGMVVVVRKNYTAKREFADAVRKLQFAEVKILGMAITRAGNEGKKYKYSKYGDKYGYYYSKPDNNTDYISGENKKNDPTKETKESIEPKASPDSEDSKISKETNASNGSKESKEPKTSKDAEKQRPPKHKSKSQKNNAKSK